MKSGMKSYPESAAVLDGLGDKIVNSLSRAVALAARDLSQYRATFPLWVAEASERGLANWIHDRLWSHVVVALDGISAVTLSDRGPTREITVGYTYRLRIKRHHEEGQISTYPTQGALEFFAQGPVQNSIPGLEEVRLAAGYKWDKETHMMGDAVLSLRDGLDVIIWEEILATPDDLGPDTVTIPPVTGPTPPTIEGPAAEDGQAKDEE
jgi:hypothetical protein